MATPVAVPTAQELAQLPNRSSRCGGAAPRRSVRALTVTGADSPHQSELSVGLFSRVVGVHRTWLTGRAPDHITQLIQFDEVVALAAQVI